MAGRPPRIRNGDYSSDAQNAIHLSRAVLLDESVSLAWRQRMREALLDVASNLMNPESNSLARKASGVRK